MMTFTQYLLNRLAEEASEVAQAALKAAAYGAEVVYADRQNLAHVNNEVIETATILSMLHEQPDINKHLIRGQSFPLSHGNDFARSVDKAKRERLCYQALVAHQNGQVEFTPREEQMVKDLAGRWVSRKPETA